MAANYSRFTVIGIVAIAVILFIIGFLIGFFAAPDSDPDCPKPGPKSTSEMRKEKQKQNADFYETLYSSLSADEINKNLQYFAARPHVAGTERVKKLADEIAKRWREYKFDKVEQPKYNVLLPKVDPSVSNKVEILDENGSPAMTFTGKEKLAEPSENDTTMIAPLLAYAKEGAASGSLLYVNYGRRIDFEDLRSDFNITDCKGKIVIMRFGKIFRGDKVKHAQECGAAGAILYNDPLDYAPEGQNKTYPDYIWLPKTGVQRGSIFGGIGDPLTPGLPAIDGISRVPQDQAGLPKIPAVPMPYGDAVHLLKLMQGYDVPEAWKGSLEINYTIGNVNMTNNKIIRITVNVPNKRQDIYNVIGTVYGEEEPDRWVLVGNHRDAWGFGAVDASSGTSSMMEISRVVGELLKKGWRPRRTIKFCSWGGEESGLIGSTEWVEENQLELNQKAVTYINIDISADGNYTFRANGSPLLKSSSVEHTMKVIDPHKKAGGGEMTVRERMTEVNQTYGKLGASSDYASFYQFIGVPALDASYRGKVFYPVYHTVHDTYKWVLLVDPNFVFHLTTSRVVARLLINTADQLLLPFDVTTYGNDVNKSMALLKSSYGKRLSKQNIKLSYMEDAVKKFVDETKKFQSLKDKTAANEISDLKIRNMNNRMVNVEKAFIYAYGLPGRAVSRHILFAPSTNNKYGTSSFPGISDLLYPTNDTLVQWQEVEKQISIAQRSILEATNALKEDAK